MSSVVARLEPSVAEPVQRSAAGRSWAHAGRRADLAALLDAFDRPAGHPEVAHLVELTGDPGIGRTTLLGEFERAVRAKGAAVLTGWGDRGAYRESFGVFIEALRERAASPPTAASVREAIEGLSPRTVVLILDDLHGADPASIGLLAELLRHPPRAPVLLVLGYRNRQAGTALYAAIEGRSPELVPRHLHLGPLAKSEVEEILRELGFSSWHRQLYEESGGNPAYLKALVSERLTFPRIPGTPGMGRGTGSALYGTFQRELDRLPATARLVADAAAVAGCEFDVELVAQALELTETATLEALDELVRCDLVRQPGSAPFFEFRHPVVRRAVYLGSELSRRVGLHVRVDVVLRARGAAAEERAPHVEQWARHGDLDAVRVLDEAARAVRFSDPLTAASWLATALRVLPRQARHEPWRADLLVQQAKARGASGDLRGCRDLMHEALPLLPRRPARRHAKAVAFTAMAQRLLGIHAAGDIMLRTELDELDEDPETRAALMFEIAARALYEGAGWAESCRLVSETLRLARAAGDRSRELSCHGLLAKAKVSAGDLEGAAAHLDTATGIFDAMLDGEFLYSLDSVIWVGWADLLLERWDDALRHFDKAVEVGVRTGRALALPHLLVGQVFALYNRGKLADAQSAAEYAVYLAQRSGSSEQLVGAYSMLSWADTLVGRYDRAAQCGLAAFGHFRGTVNGFEALGLRMLAEAKLLGGDPEGCLAMIDILGGPNLPETDACSRVAWYELLTRAEVALARPEGATKWSESATAAADLLGQPGRSGLASLARAEALLLTEPADALFWAERAVRSLSDAGMAVDAHRARITLGVALSHHDRYDDAVRELQQAQTALDALGAPTLGRIARTERRRLAARSPRNPRYRAAGASGTGTEIAALLTDRERQVAELVGEGLTNRLIAKRLHIAEKTVEMHLSKVFAKLGAANRAAVAALIIRSMPVPRGS